MKIPVLQTVVLLSFLVGCARRHESGFEPAPAAAPSRASGSQTPYTKPLTSLGAKFGAMPVAVQNTVRAEAGTEEIADVLKETSPDRVYYKVLFRASNRCPPLYVAPDGSVLNPDLTVAVHAARDATGALAAAPVLVSTENLPPSVTKAIHDRAPDAEISLISRRALGDQVVYVVSFKDSRRHPKLTVFADGTVLETPAP
jgi:hypothetical protein